MEPLIEDEEIEIGQRSRDAARRLSFGKFTPAQPGTNSTETPRSPSVTRTRPVQERTHTLDDVTDNTGIRNRFLNTEIPTIKSTIRKIMPKQKSTGQSAEISRSMIMSLIDLEQCVPDWRKVDENYSKSIEQAANWMRRPTDKTKGAVHQFDKLKKAADERGETAQREIQKTLQWLSESHWDISESAAMIAHILTEDLGEKTDTSITVANTMVMFCQHGLDQVERFEEMTSKGRIDLSTHYKEGETIMDTPGFKWLDPNDGTYITHHAYAWDIMLTGISSILGKKPKPIKECEEAIAAWVAKGQTMSFIGKLIPGKLEHRPKGKRWGPTLNAEEVAWQEMVESLCHHDLATETPSSMARAANLVALEDKKERTIRMQRQLAKNKPNPIPLHKVTFEKVTAIILEMDERSAEEYWIPESDEEPEEDKPEQQKSKKEKDSKRAKRPEGKAKLNAKEYTAIVKYSKYGLEGGPIGKSHRDVDIEELKKGRGVEYWASYEPNQPTSHGSAPETSEGKKNKTCHFFNTPSGCRKGDQCDFAHVRKEPTPDKSENESESSAAFWTCSLTDQDDDQNEVQVFWASGKGSESENENEGTNGEDHEEAHPDPHIANEWPTPAEAYTAPNSERSNTTSTETTQGQRKRQKTYDGEEGLREAMTRLQQRGMTRRFIRRRECGSLREAMTKLRQHGRAERHTRELTERRINRINTTRVANHLTMMRADGRPRCRCDNWRHRGGRCTARTDNFHGFCDDCEEECTYPWERSEYDTTDDERDEDGFEEQNCEIGRTGTSPSAHSRTEQRRGDRLAERQACRTAVDKLAEATRKWTNRHDQHWGRACQREKGLWPKYETEGTKGHAHDETIEWGVDNDMRETLGMREETNGGPGMDAITMHGNRGSDREGRPVTAFVAWIDGQRVIVGVDTYTEVTLISDELQHESWKRTKSGGLRITGVGAATTGDEVETKLQLRHRDIPERIIGRLCNPSMLPKRVDILLGTQIQHELDITIRQGIDRLEVGNTRSGRGIVIELEEPSILKKRMNSRPMKVLDLASGSAAAYMIMMDLGWNVEEWIACEIDEEVRQIAKANCPIIQHTENDLLKLAQKSPTKKYDLVLAATPCKGFSQANDNATGMNGEDGKLMKAAAHIINKVKEVNPKVKIIMENVKLNDKLKGDREIQDSLISIPFKELTALHQGASQLRTRRIATNITDIERIPKKRASDPNNLLGKLAFSKERITPCIMAKGSDTRNPVTVTDRTSKEERHAWGDEKDALQGYPIGISAGIGRNERESLRTKVSGNMWNYHQMSAILRQLNSTCPETGAEETSARHSVIENVDEAEMRWHRMGSEEQLKELENKMSSFELKKLRISLKPDQTIPYQVPKHARMKTPEHRREAALAEIKLRLKRNHLKLVKYESKQWIANMFCKGKNRINPETGLEAIRLLTDFRKLNAALDWPKFWTEECPTIDRVKQSIPKGSTHYAGEDQSDAYESAGVEEDSRHYLTAIPPIQLKASMFSDEELMSWGIGTVQELREAEHLLVQWSGTPQGLSVSATFYNGHLADGFNHLLGESWRSMWTVYVDDALIHGFNYKHCQMRQKLFRNCMKAMGKRLSTKGDTSVKEYGEIVGLKISRRGIQSDESCVTALKEELRNRPKSIKQLRRLIGIVQYSAGAFEWSAENLTWWSNAMRPLHEAATAERFNWNNECQASVEGLLLRLNNIPRAHVDPETILDDEHCIIIMSDACDTGIGAGMWLVNKGDAREVTPDDLKNHQIAQLMTTDSKVLSKAEERWFTFEKETYAMYHALKKWGPLLINATQHLGIKQRARPKIGLRLDNTKATKTWIDLQDPGPIEHAGAKEMRFLGWSERMAFLLDLPVHTSFCPGSLNSFADLISRIAEIMAEATRIQREVVVAAHGSKSNHQQISITESEPEADENKVRHIRLPKECGDEIDRAMRNDNATVHGIRMGDLYKFMLGEESSPETRNKIGPLVNRIYFMRKHPDTERMTLYTLKSAQRVQWSDEDDTKTLVQYIPPECKVKLIQPDNALDIKEDDPEWLKCQETLRGQIILLCHDMDGHPRESNTLQAVRSISYWQTQGKDVSEHWWTCPDCQEEVTIRKGIGTGIIALKRFGAIQIDHYILQKTWSNTCGCTCILTITDSSTRITSYEVARDQSAQESARIIYDRWIPYYGTPVKISSDNHPGFASEVMSMIRELMGIREHDMSAPESKGNTSQVENRHNILSLTLADGFAKGDIKDERDLQTYCNRAKVKQDFQSADGASPFECAFGQMPRSAIDSVLSTPDETEVVAMHISMNQIGSITEQGFLQWLEDNRELTKSEKSNEDGHEVMYHGEIPPEMFNNMPKRTKAQLIHQHAEEILRQSLYKRDETARRNLTRRVSKAQKAPYAYQLNLNIGDEVSYDGKAYEVEHLTPAISGQTTATIRTKSGGSKIKNVMVDKLRRTCTPRPVRMLPRKKPSEDDLIVWDDPDGDMCRVGIVTEEGDTMSVHEYSGTEETLQVWIPLWQAPGKLIKRRVRQPRGYAPVCHDVDQRDVLITGNLTDTGRLDEKTRREMHARNLIPDHVCLWSIPEHGGIPDIGRKPTVAVDFPDVEKSIGEFRS